MITPGGAGCGLRASQLQGGSAIQTFLPYPEYDRTARVLDRARLGKQRVEVLQILRALRIEGYGWRTHPAVTMWTGHVEALVAYGEACNVEWAGRGHPDTTRLQILEFAPGARSQSELAVAGLLPPWHGDAELHRSHQSALVRKDPVYYRPLFGDVPDDLPYHWPDPPEAPPREEHPFSAWVVRAPSPALLGTFVAHGAAAVETAEGMGALEHLAQDAPKRRRTKRFGIIERFVDAMERGDVVVVPVGDEQLMVGEITGDYEWVPLPPVKGVHHTRRVRWRGFVPRAALRDPAALQDPQLIFALHGEDALTVEAQT